MKKYEADFEPHCFELNCDMGSFHYNCVHCDKYSVDYLIWLEKDKVLSGDKHDFNCKKCKGNLTVSFDKEECEYFVTEN